HMITRMCSARAILGRNVRSFYMKSFHRLRLWHLVASKFLLGVRQVSQTAHDVVLGSSNNRCEKASYARGEHVANGTGNLLARRPEVVIVDPSEAVHLNIHKSGRDKFRGVWRTNQFVHCIERAIVVIDLDDGGRSG